MKQFLFKSFLFCFVSFLVLCMIFKGISLTQNRVMKVDEDIHIAFLGNSHFEAGINDSIIENSINWSSAAELVESVYAKTKLIIRNNPQIDTIFVSYDHILGFRALYKDFNSNLVHPYYLSEFSFQDWFTIIRNGEFCYWTSFLHYPLNWDKFKFLKYYIHKDQTLNKTHYLGKYIPLTEDKLEKSLKAKPGPGPQGEMECNAIARYFLRKTIDYGKEHNVQIIFLCLPIYNKNYYYDKKSLVLEYEKYFADVPFINDMNMDIPDSCFSDLHHLNYKGSILYSNYLNNKLHHKE